MQDVVAISHRFRAHPRTGFYNFYRRLWRFQQWINLKLLSSGTDAAPKIQSNPPIQPALHGSPE
jgi:hypothetical protein